jgi:hypothetical protein
MSGPFEDLCYAPRIVSTERSFDTPRVGKERLREQHSSVAVGVLLQISSERSPFRPRDGAGYVSLSANQSGVRAVLALV